MRMNKENVNKKYFTLFPTLFHIMTRILSHQFFMAMKPSLLVQTGMSYLPKFLMLIYIFIYQ